VALLVEKSLAAFLLSKHFAYHEEKPRFLNDLPDEDRNELQAHWKFLASIR